METTADPLPTVEADAVRTRRRRWPYWLVAAATAVVLIAGVAVAAWADRYQPLRLCCVSALGTAPPDKLDSTSSFAGASIISNVLGDEFQVPASPGSSVDMAFVVSNTGQYPVKLLAVSLPDQLGPGVRKSVWASPIKGGGFGPPYAAFRPTTLAASDDVALMVTVTYPSACPDQTAPKAQPGDGVFSGIQVTYEYAGLRHTRYLTMRTARYSVIDPPFCW